MFGHKMKTPLLSTVAACAMVVGLGTNSASAMTIEDAWNLNLSVANGVMFDGGGGSFAGLVDRGNIDHAILQGISTVTQTVVNGSALGQPFSDNGILGVTRTVAEGSVFQVPLILGNAGVLYFEFSGLTGTLANDATIMFDPGVGTIRLLLDSDQDGNSATGNIVTLAAFDLIAPSGGSNLDFHGGTAANSTIDVTLLQTSGIAGLFTDMNDVEFAMNDPLTTHFGNMGALLNPNINPNPDPSNLNGVGTGTTDIHVLNGGQYNIATTPPTRVSEPSSLAALGFGLLGLMGMASRRRRKTA